MLTLTRPYRQALATLGLILFSVVPTIYVGLTAVRINRPGHVRDVEIELRRTLGLQVTLQGVRYPRPGEVVYHGMVLRQEEARKGELTEVARADLVRLRKLGKSLTLETDNLVLRGPSPKAAMAQVGMLLGRSGEGQFDQVSLAAPTCKLDLGDGTALSFEVKELAAVLDNNKDSPRLTASYRVAGLEGTTRCELELLRDRGVDPVATTLSLKTMEGVPLPGRMLNLFFVADEWIGSTARVQGALTLRQQGDGEWMADFTGDLLNVDLGTLFSRQFPRQRMTGLANVNIKRATWTDRPGQGMGWTEVEGELVTGPGSAGFDLLRSLTSEMNFRVARRIDGSKPDVSFRTLAFRFKLDTDGQIVFNGCLTNEFAPDDVLVINDRPVLKAPQGTANVRGLIKTLFPGSAETLVPVTAESQVLSRFLPLPKGAPFDPSTVKTLKAN